MQIYQHLDLSYLRWLQGFNEFKEMLLAEQFEQVLTYSNLCRIIHQHSFFKNNTCSFWTTAVKPFNCGFVSVICLKKLALALHFTFTSPHVNEHFLCQIFHWTFSSESVTVHGCESFSVHIKWRFASECLRMCGICCGVDCPGPRGVAVCQRFLCAALFPFQVHNSGLFVPQHSGIRALWCSRPDNRLGFLHQVLRFSKHV